MSGMWNLSDSCEVNERRKWGLVVVIIVRLRVTDGIGSGKKQLRSEHYACFNLPCKLKLRL